MSEIVSRGHSFAFGFLALCSGIGVLNVMRGLFAANGAGLTLALAQAIFALFAGTAAWYIYHWKKAGWYLGLVVVLQWLSAIVNLGHRVDGFTLVLTFPMVIVGIWLFWPGVKAKFGVIKLFA